MGVSDTAATSCVVLLNCVPLDMENVSRWPFF